MSKTHTARSRRSDPKNDRPDDMARAARAGAGSFPQPFRASGAGQEGDTRPPQQDGGCGGKGGSGRSGEEAPARPRRQEHAPQPRQSHAAKGQSGTQPRQGSAPAWQSHEQPRQGGERDSHAAAPVDARRGAGRGKAFRNTLLPDGQPRFLPMSRREMDDLGWDALDVLFISGDAYIDHPSFGIVLLGRWLVRQGFRVGVIAQPDWRDPASVTALGRPRLFAGVTAGALDSLLAHYTAFRKKRHEDAYTPGGKAGARPNRASIIYTNLVRQAFPGLPVVLGGIEASLRRISHYDFWTDALRRSLLLDAKADVLVYGMGERAIVELARRAAAHEPLTHVAGTAWVGRAEDVPEDAERVDLPAHEAMLADKRLLMRGTLDMEMQVHQGTAYAVQPVGGRAVILAPPAPCLTTEEMDALYAMPFARRAHPSYTQAIPADAMMRTSITSHRGCGGGCSFCSLALHQGRRISSRSEDSILREVASLTAGGPVAISDVGGPTANMWQAHCTADKVCRRRSCCFPKICPHFLTPQRRHVDLLRRLRDMPEIKQVRVASGVRADIALQDVEAMRAYTLEFTGGQLKVAPEHCAAGVLRLMRKPALGVFEEFLQFFLRQSRNAGKEQYVVPYLMSAFPGCTEADMRELAAWLKQRHWAPQQVQCFIPTPGTVATAMYYAGVDEQGDPLPVARTDAERLKLHGILMPDMGRKHAPARDDGMDHLRDVPPPERCEGDRRERDRRERDRRKQDGFGQDGPAAARAGRGADTRNRRKFRQRNGDEH